MTFRQFSTRDEAYSMAIQLRDAHLRAPLGLKLNELDTAGEDQQLHFGLFDGQRILACVSFKQLDDKRMKLRQMVVDPSLQRSGLGRTLIANAEETLMKRGCLEITLSARASARAFYEKLGYRAIGESFVEVGIEHLKMDKSL
ncbi:GNAT family N-acetyltransferase [Pelagicoccus sp. NFK12]|uniref:GNAT family N-acetyltransferase n=1 Tax=Pelagicoccus enzymogenes TaxID=2773457 RepID=A0A927FCH6_9BACT|nr:GNAT family N-acetyltransferase [Pelagicoccus enzymogenes]MBD5781251.1 GNAT family N-acetyltransferase [Pelagicoccus enzymogenes]